MSQVLSSLGGMFSGGEGGSGGIPSWMKLLLGGLAGTGEIGNILADRQRGSVLSNLQSKEKAFEALTPQQLSAKVAGATQPLSAGLTQAVGNLVQGEVGERGLAQSPGVFSASLAQALAPYYQQNQNTALQEVMRQMGLPIEYAQAEQSMLPGQTNLSPLLALLLRSVSGGGSTSGVSMGPTPAASFPTPTDWSGGGSGGGDLTSITGP